MRNLEELKEKLKADKEKRRETVIEYFKTMKPFDSVDNIPQVPIMDKETYEEVIVKNLIRCGAIPKDKLEVGATYEGDCRNFIKAKWDGEKFIGRRYKFGSWYDEEINHFQDDDGHDVFVPIRKI